MSQIEKQRLFVDMDGTLAKFSPVNQLEALYEKGYFESLPPQDNVLEAVKLIISNYPEIEVNILSAYLTDSAYALDEKNAWLDKYLPEISSENRIFLPCGSEKSEYVENLGVTDFLLDDYTANLNSWEPPARGIKLLTDINNTKGTWSSDRIRFDKPGNVIAENVVSIMKHNQRIYDNNPQRRSEISDNQHLGEIMGIASWKSGERDAFTDAETFIETVKEELEYRATSGFSYKVLTSDPYIRKSIDDLLYDMSGEKNKNDMEHYKSLPLQPENSELAEYFSGLQRAAGLDVDVIKDAYKQGLLLNADNNGSCCLQGDFDISTVAVFGDTVSALSHATLARLMFSDYSSADRLVLSGYKSFEALKRHLDQNPSIKNIAICFNADISGDKAASELKDNLLKDGYSPENGYHCERQLPTEHTNFNEYLKSYRAALENGQHFQQEDVENIEQEP